ncbi:uncharacterized protein LOC129569009 [Sitodiplosis mosellana]|uniref:uncharacterized protein LOC129569009 n=1 Tax=Sitodiplosis mosellana TaxID=263140 RepID=UPI0024438428|nr:uncharacterized protein LOC129569009 [Sitodiplosis mosellana]XP_055303357.1 uncharacterized protein LOC129569009 [Sitodiplosis mosellana]
MASVWDNFSKLAELSLNFKDLSGTTGGIYANGRNRIEVQIAVRVLGSFTENGNTVTKPITLTENDLKDNIYFCDYLTGGPLDSKWTVWDSANEYTKGFRTRQSVSTQQSNSITKSLDTEAVHVTVNAVGTNPDVGYISKYFSCTKGNSEKTFAVGINIPGVGNFDTSKNGTTTWNGPGGVGKSRFISPAALTVTATPELVYAEKNLIIEKAYRRNETKKRAVFKSYASGWYATKEFEAYYDNYYITVENGIQRIDLHSYGGEPTNKWIAELTSNHNNQHMIVVHPFGTGQQTNTFGFWGTVNNGSMNYNFELEQYVTFNDRPGAFCISQLTFMCNSIWDLPDGVGIGGWTFNNWFDLYDTYGNHGRFKPVYDDSHQFIEIHLA